MIFGCIFHVAISICSCPSICSRPSSRASSLGWPRSSELRISSEPHRERQSAASSWVMQLGRIWKHRQLSSETLHLVRKDRGNLKSIFADKRTRRNTLQNSDVRSPSLPERSLYQRGSLRSISRTGMTRNPKVCCTTGHHHRDPS
jgi:hypothetical protein